MAKHVGQTTEQLSARLVAETKIPTASTFVSRAEAEAASSQVLNARSSDIAAWVANGTKGVQPFSAPYSGGMVLQRGDSDVVSGSSAAFVLKSNGKGVWYILTGYPGL